MIINGDYKFIDFDKLRGQFIEVFSEYYGEKYRDIITKTINDIEYHPYHTMDFVCDYYNEYMFTHSDELSSIFFEIIGVERTPELDKLIMPKSADMQPEIFLAVSGGEDIANDHTLTPEGKEYVANLRQSIKEAFNFQGNDQEVYQKIIGLYNAYIQAESITDQNNICEVSRDINQLLINSNSALIQYLREAKDYGYDVSFDDIAYVTKENFNPNFVQYLRCKDVLFGDELNTPGLISNFTSKSNKILKTGKDYQKIEIITERLKYIASLKIPFLYITPEMLYEPSDDPAWRDKVLAEYEYQKKMEYDFNYIDYFGYDDNQLKKNFKKGQFFPEELADRLEDIRDRCCNELVYDCKFYEKRYPYPINASFEYFTIFDYKNRNIDEPYSAIYFKEDHLFKDEDLLRIMIHEVNHAISHNFSLTDDKYVTSKIGLNYKVRERDGEKIVFDGPDPLYYNDIVQLSEENENERQAKELLEIYKSKYPVDLGFAEDTIYKFTPEKFNCGYEAYNFLIEDFYNRYHDQLKRHKVDPAYNIYFDHNLPLNAFENIMCHLTDKFNRTFRKSKYARNGILDFYKVEKLSKVINEFNSDIIPDLLRNKLLIDEEIDYDNLDSETYIKILRLLAKKDKIMSKIFRDERKFSRITDSDELSID